MLRFAVIVLIVVGLAGLLFTLFVRRAPVPTISAKKLRELQQSPGNTKFVVIDVRSTEELSVSMIPGAITSEQFEEEVDAYRDSTIIPYCTVGVRSERYARKLLDAGHTALNFKGSILGWCEAGYPLVTPDGEPTTRVHTYSDDYEVPAEYTAVY